MSDDVSRLGLGAMIRMLGSNDSAAVVRAAVGKTITGLYLKDDALHFGFDDGSTMTLSDKGQSCCEHRYMVTDDPLPSFVGAQFLGAEIVNAPDVTDSDGDVHEVQFLNILTSLGRFQMASHNEHNGYYGGFSIEAEGTPTRAAPSETRDA